MRRSLACRWLRLGVKNSILLTLNLGKKKSVLHSQGHCVVQRCCLWDKWQQKSDLYSHGASYSTSAPPGHYSGTCINHNIKPVIPDLAIHLEQNGVMGFRQGWRWYTTHHANVAVPLFHIHNDSYPRKQARQYIGCWILKFKLVEHYFFVHLKASIENKRRTWGTVAKLSDQKAVVNVTCMGDK